MNILKDTAYPVDQTGYPNFSITAITVICPIVPVKYNLIAFFLSTELSMSSSFVSQNMYNSLTDDSLSSKTSVQGLISGSYTEISEIIERYNKEHEIEIG